MSDSKEARAVAPACSSPWAAWVAGTVTISDDSNTSTNPGFTASSGSPTVGVDYRLCHDLVLGTLFNFTTAGVNFSDGSTLDADTELLGVYANWAHGPWFVNGLVGGGISSYDQHRTTLNLGGTEALASPNGSEVLANVTSGYDFRVAGWVLSPDAGLLYTHLSKDSFSETGAGAFDLNVGRQDVDSLRTKLGFHVTRPFTWDSIKFTPEMHASWYHECLDDTDGVSTSVPGAPALGSFVVTTNPQGRDFALVGAGLSANPAEFHNNVTFFLNYDAQVGHADYIAHTMNGGIRVNF
jgi:outer membrane autotransporter protein